MKSFFYKLVTGLVLLHLLALGVSQWLPASTHTHELAYYGGTPGNYDLFLADVEHGLSVNLTRNPGEDSRPAWSPDGQRLVFYANRERRTDLYLMDASGRGIRRLAETGVASALPAWSPNGEWIAFAIDHIRGLGLYRIRPDGSGQQQLVDFRVVSIHWSPDNQYILFTADCDNNCDLFVIRADGTDLRRLTRNGVVDAYPSWSPDSRQIAFMSTRDRFYELYVIDLNCDEKPLGGCTGRRLTQNRDFDGFPDWSPDGSLILFSSDRDGSPDIYTVNADCRVEQGNCVIERLTAHPGSDASPRWSTDGRWVAFINGFEIYVISAAGGLVQHLSRQVLRDQVIAWRPDQQGVKCKICD